MVISETCHPPRLYLPSHSFSAASLNWLSKPLQTSHKSTLHWFTAVNYVELRWSVRVCLRLDCCRSDAVCCFGTKIHTRSLFHLCPLMICKEKSNTAVFIWHFLLCSSTALWSQQFSTIPRGLTWEASSLDLIIHRATEGGHAISPDLLRIHTKGRENI